MKSPTWSQVVLVALAIAGLIVSAKYAPDALGIVGTIVTGLSAWLLPSPMHSNSPTPPPAALLALFMLLPAMPGCKLFTPDRVNTVLDDAQLACVTATLVTDEVVVADVCKISSGLTYVIREILDRKKAGLAASDAGTD